MPEIKFSCLGVFSPHKHVHITTGSEDFVPIERAPLTLSSMNSRNCINITIIGDGLIEMNESFYAVFELEENTTLPVTIFPVSCRISVTILDDDGMGYRKGGIYLALYPPFCFLSNHICCCKALQQRNVYVSQLGYTPLHVWCVISDDTVFKGGTA